MLAIKMLLRGWRGGQLGLIFWSLVLAVTVVTSVALLAERVLERRARHPLRP